jgi:phage protein D
VDQPVLSQAEADKLAAARLDELSGAFVQAEGTAFRRPDIKAGQWLQLKSLGHGLAATIW